MTFAFYFFGDLFLLTQAFIMKNLNILLGSILSITMINAHADQKKDIVTLQNSLLVVQNPCCRR